MNPCSTPRRWGALLMMLLCAGSLAATPDLTRDRALELPTPYVPPPGDRLVHEAGGYARILCSAVFITGLDLAFAEEHVGYFIAPKAMRAHVGKPVVDRARKTVTVPLPDGSRRVARYLGSQGCVTLGHREKALHFTPQAVQSALPDPSLQPWPMGDRGAAATLPGGVDSERIRKAVDAAFARPEGQTAAVVVTWKGRIIGERYAPGITVHTPLESWSMGKSMSATLMGVLIQQGAYDLWQKAPIPEWSAPGDPRAEIRIADLLRMSSGLRIRAPYDPDYDKTGPYPDHLYLYTAGENVYRYAATRPLEWPPNTVGRYRNTDPVLVNYLIRLATERRHEDYLSFPQRALFDRIGIRTMVIETDPYGNFLGQGADLASARDWARLGNLYLQDGVWNGERILPEGYAKFVSTLAPAWLADNQPVYGGFFWVNGDGGLPIPKSAYAMMGAGGQMTVIIPSHDLVVVRLGHYQGEDPGLEDFNTALAQLVAAVPAHD